MNIGIKHLIFFVIFLSAVEATRAETRLTPEGVALHAVEMSMRLFAKEHNGQMPTNWLQVGTYLDIDNLNQHTLIKSSAYPLQEHYVFVNQEIPMLGNLEGKVILIRAESSPNLIRDGKMGRYIISDYMGTSLFNWYPEEKVQQMLAKAGVKELPKPEPLVPHTNTVQLPEFQTSNHSEAVKPLPKIQPNANPERTETNLQTKSESVQNVQTTFFKGGRIIAIAALILMLLGWLFFRRERKR